MIALHPEILLWLEDPEKRQLIHRIKRAEDKLSKDSGGNFFGATIITYRDSRVQKVTVEKRENV